MASILAHRACSSAFRANCHLPSRVLLATRSIHSSPIVQKKKSKYAAAEEEADDLFSDDLFVEEDLIKAEPEKASSESTPTTPDTTSPPTSSPKQTANKKNKLTPAQRKARFQTHIDYLEPRLGRNPTVENPRIRKRSLVTLVQLASSEEQLRAVADLLPKYKAGNIELSSNFAEAFARRCDELKCPLLALEVFGNFAKYNTHLTLDAGRSLVHSLTSKHPHHLAVALGLFNAYHLPPISEDLVTASLVASSYTQQKVKVPGMKDIAERLRQPIEEMLKTSKGGFDSPPDQRAKRMNNWVKLSLARANKFQEKRGREVYVDPSLVPSNKIPPTPTPTLNANA